MINNIHSSKTKAQLESLMSHLVKDICLMQEEYKKAKYTIETLSMKIEFQESQLKEAKEAYHNILN